MKHLLAIALLLVSHTALAVSTDLTENFQDNWFGSNMGAHETSFRAVKKLSEVNKTILALKDYKEKDWNCDDSRPANVFAVSKGSFSSNGAIGAGADAGEWIMLQRTRGCDPDNFSMAVLFLVRPPFAAGWYALETKTDAFGVRILTAAQERSGSGTDHPTKLVILGSLSASGGQEYPELNEIFLDQDKTGHVIAIGTKKIEL